MMHLEYKKTAYLGSHIHIQPDHECDVPKLREMVTNNMNIKNPVVCFSEKMKAGEYESVPEENIEAEAKVVDILSDLWDGEYCMNVMMLLSRAMQELVDMKLEK
ncbi:MAG: hypothetical protein ILP17_04835 [Lachnospiraceae bacterium]|nr:hypothetical protein [Lachnospiraceae bacterium]